MLKRFLCVLSLLLLVFCVSWCVRVISEEDTKAVSVFTPTIGDMARYPTQEVKMTPCPSPTITPTFFPTFSPSVRATLRAEMYLTVFPRPTVPAAYPTPESPQANLRLEYITLPEIYIGDYVIRSWTYPDFPDTWFDTITIAKVGEEMVVFDNVEVDTLTGVDITGDGVPEVVLDFATGGSKCCYGHIVYSLGDKLDKIMEVYTGECRGRFEDLNEDGIYEYITCDSSYILNPFGGGCPIYPVLVFEYNREIKQYEDATRKFRGAVQENLDYYLEKVRPGDDQCWIAGAAIQYLYMDDEKKARELVETYYEGDVEKFWQKIIEEVDANKGESLIFVP